MQVLAYIFFVISSLFYIGIAMLTASKPNMRGDSGMGYGLALLYLSLGFAFSSLILTLIVRSKGGYDWMAQGAGTRTMLILVFWLSMSLITFFGALFKMEWHDDGAYPQFLRWLAVGQSQLWIPSLWLIVCFLSLNPVWLTTISPQVFKIPFWVGFTVSTLFTGGLVVGYINDSIQRTNAEVATRIDDAKRLHQQHLDEIAAHKPEDSILVLLSFTTHYQDNAIRQAALAKIKSHPDWEDQLLELLANQYYYKEVYSFLGSNPVAHPEAFIQPLNQSIVQLSVDISAEIKVGYNLQNWSFDSYGIDYVLQAIDNQFSGQIATFYPNVVKLKQTLNRPLPEHAKGIRFTATDVVDTWLKAHKK